MSNLLPQGDQKKIWSLYRARLVIAFSSFLTITAVLAAIILVPSYLALGKPPQESDNSQSAMRADDRTQIAEAQALISALSPIVSATSSPSAALLHALSLKPPAITITHATYAPGSIMLSGTAKTPADLDAYRRSLSSDPSYSSVVVPVQDLVGVSGGNFSITISGMY